jgi:Tol biopolymer transport system component
MADFDPDRLDRGGAALSAMRRVSDDGGYAENPTMTKSLAWIVYSSSNPEKAGIWKIRPSGKDATRLVKTPFNYLPDVSPDGRYAAYVLTDAVNRRNTIRVVEVESGRDTGFEIALPYTRGFSSADVQWGRTRWAPDGLSLLFIAQEESGQAGVYRQRFAPGIDTRGTREQLVGSLPGAMTESLTISPDGQFLTVSDGHYVRRLMVAEHVPGVRARRRVP